MTGSKFPPVPGTTRNSEPVPGSRPVPDRFPEPVKLSGSRFPHSKWEPREPVTVDLAPRAVSKSEVENREPVERPGFDVLLLPAALFAGLPLRASLLCRLRNTDVRFIVTSSRPVWEAIRRAGGLVFGTIELDALTAGAENDRANPSSLAQWCEWKRQEPTWRLDQAEALGGIHNVLPPQGWTLERVLRAYGAELVAVGCGDEVPT